MTKFVGDFLGVTGIADEAIRFNGYPFLEKDDHQYNVSVARVMRKDLHTLPVSGLTVGQIGECLLIGVYCRYLSLWSREHTREYHS